ncbi:hypothetical protein [Acetobacter estunensis]|uniref:hypothetical protein n=1 Tax=Acetobacter estunensis TaxID=104097 RepID=UPI0020C2DA54|nr:hypothetical protein [Acetobacter estunensis]
MSDVMLSPQVDFGSNVIPFRMGFLARHREYLARWLEAGQRMGLCSTEICIDEDAPATCNEVIVVWVRENASPAYLIRPDGARWLVIDALRDTTLSRESSLEMALDFIRPALPIQDKVVAA